MNDEKTFYESASITTDTDCWIWQKSLTSGYGRTCHKGKLVLAHRLAYYYFHKEWPEICRHICDNRKCVNPNHLLTGTKKDNSNDAVERNRTAKGALSGNSKLTEFQVGIVKTILGKKPDSVIAKRFNVSPLTIRDIRTGRTWSHIKTPKKTTDRIDSLKKHSDSKVVEIRKMLKNGYKQSVIAKKFNLDPSTISKIACGKRRSNV